MIWSAGLICKVESDVTAEVANNYDYSMHQQDDIDEFVQKSSSQASSWMVTVQYAGWKHEWDEVLPWDSERLAPICTYSRRVKGLVNIFTKTAKSYKKQKGRKKSKHLVVDKERLWPCRVFFRMPNPGCFDADDLLRSEDKVLVKPYNADVLRKKFHVSLCDDGLWLNCSECVHPFDLNSLSKNSETRPHDGFTTAFLEACNDETTIGFVPNEPCVPGTSLPSEQYRVTTNSRKRRFDGCMGEASIEFYKEEIQRLKNHEIVKTFLPKKVISSGGGSANDKVEIRIEKNAVSFHWKYILLQLIQTMGELVD